MVVETFFVKTNSTKQALFYDKDVSAYIISVRSSPTKGKANNEIIKFLKKRIKSSNVKITILKGKTSTKKLIEFTNLDQLQLSTKLLVTSK